MMNRRLCCSFLICPLLVSAMLNVALGQAVPGKTPAQKAASRHGRFRPRNPSAWPMPSLTLRRPTAWNRSGRNKPLPIAIGRTSSRRNAPPPRRPSFAINPNKAAITGFDPYYDPFGADHPGMTLKEIMEQESAAGPR